jgi:hypothetical protein
LCPAESLAHHPYIQDHIEATSCKTVGLEGEYASQRGARGIPSPIMAMMSRWISFVPPPNVKMV